jgi:anti-sigma factor RsiW
MTAPDAIARDDLHAYVDGRLGPEVQARIEAKLAQHSEDAAAVQAYRQQNRDLRETFAPVLDEPLPPALQAAVTARTAMGPRATPSLWPGWALAASVLLLLVGGAGGWLLHGWQATPGRAGGSFAEQALGAHRVFVSEVRHPVEVGAEQEAHLVGWLSKRLGTKLRAPELRAAGFELVGGRLLAEGAQPAAQLMYEDDGGRRLTLYLRAIEGAEQTAFRFVEAHGVAAFYWIDEDYAYALVAPLERDRLLAIAHQVYEDLER